MWPYAIISVAIYLLKNLVVWSYNTDKGTNMCIYVCGVYIACVVKVTNS